MKPMHRQPKKAALVPFPVLLRRTLPAIAGLGLLASTETWGAAALTEDLAVHLKFDGNYLDASGRGLHGTAVGEPRIVPGQVGSGALGFSSDKLGGFFNYVTLGAPEALNFGAHTEFSISFWFKYSQFSGAVPLVANKDWRSDFNQGWILHTWGVNMQESEGASLGFKQPYLAVFGDGRWHHVVVTAERAGYARMFLEGEYVDVQNLFGDQYFKATFIGPGRPTVDTRPGLAVNIGQDGTGQFTGGGTTGIADGTIDDLAIWRRRLSASEVKRIYQAGLNHLSLADIATPAGPVVTADPGFQSVPLGGTASFRVAATGSEPLSWQWLFEGVPIDGATTPTLTLPGIGEAQRGSYSARVTNAWGTDTSHPAILRLEFPMAVGTTGMGSVRRDPDLSSYPAGSVVRLIPEPAPGFVFDGWDGDTAGSAVPLEVTVDRARNVTARFASSLGSVSLTTTGEVSVQASRSLRKGWNAVFLDVAPEVAQPGLLFTNTPIEIVATYFPFSSPVEFIRNPTDQPWKEKGWGVWYAPNHPEAFLTSLYAILPNRAYLVYCREPFIWRVSGRVHFQRTAWQPDSFNFVGLPVDPNAPPTFARFFAGSPAHQGSRGPRIYRLVDDGWVPIANPAQSPIEYGTAYWIHCQGGSDYQGPLDVRLPFGTEADFGNIASDLRIRLFNTSPDPVAIQAQTLGGAGSLPLTHRKRYLAEARNEYLPLAGALNLGTVESADVFDLNLSLQRSDLTSPASSTIVELISDAGVRFRFAGRAQSAIPTQP